MTRTITFGTFCMVIAVGFTIVGILIATSLATILPRAEPEPCALPTVEPAEIQLHKGTSATEAAYSEWLGLDGGTE